MPATPFACAGQSPAVQNHHIRLFFIEYLYLKKVSLPRKETIRTRSPFHQD